MKEAVAKAASSLFCSALRGGVPHRDGPRLLDLLIGADLVFYNASPFTELMWLGDIIPGSKFFCLFNAGAVGCGRQNDNGDRSAFLDLGTRLQKLLAVHQRHVEVQKYQVRFYFAGG